MKPEHKREALLRMKTVTGQAQGVLEMIDREEYCVNVMKQVASLQASLERVNRVLLQNHLETCMTQSIRTGGGQAKIDELMQALKFDSSLTDYRHLEYLASRVPSRRSGAPPKARSRLPAR